MVAITIREYRPREGSRLGNKTVQIVAREFEKLDYQLGRQITPADVVEAARPEASPLHRHFTWDKDKAADQWNRHEARQLLEAVEIKVSESPPVWTRAWESIVITTAPDEVAEGEEPATPVITRRYVHIDTVMQDGDMIRQKMADFDGQLKHWRKRLAVFADLPAIATRYRSVIQAIDELPEDAED